MQLMSFSPTLHAKREGKHRRQGDRRSHLVPRPAVLEREVGRGVQPEAPGGAQHEGAQLDDQGREPGDNARRQLSIR